MSRFLIAMACLFGLAGCDALQPDKSGLWATSSAPVERPRCDACHGYAPRTGAHRYHLDTTMQLASRHSIRQITCADCHAASIAYSPPHMQDTLYSSNNNHVPDKHTAGFPWRDFPRPPTFDDILSLDSVPLAWAPREAGAENPFWVTASAKGPGMPGHANGNVDVIFAERNATWYPDDTTQAPQRASWDPVRLSCNAVSCHGSCASQTSRYIWKDVVEETKCTGTF